MAIKLRTLVKFPAQVLGDIGVAVTRLAGVYTFFLRLRDFVALEAVPALADKEVVVFERGAAEDGSDDVYNTISLSVLVGSIFSGEQHITAPGPVTVGNDVSVARVDQAIGAAIVINLPPAADKSVPVLVADWKGDAGTNNITIVPNGAERIQGLANWTIGADNGSIFLRPIPGVGYAI
jgi:hypothetical protein